MRRPRAGDETLLLHPGGAGAPPGSLGTPARSWLTAAGSPGRVGFKAWLPSGGRRWTSRKTPAQESGTESAARRRKEDAAMERREARTRRHGCPRRKAWIAKDAPLGAPSPRFIRGGEGLPAEARRAKAGTTAYPAPQRIGAMAHARLRARLRRAAFATDGLPAEAPQERRLAYPAPQRIRAMTHVSFPFPGRGEEACANDRKREIIAPCKTTRRQFPLATGSNRRLRASPIRTARARAPVSPSIATPPSRRRMPPMRVRVTAFRWGRSTAPLSASRICSTSPAR